LAIRYFTEDLSFRFTGRRKTSRWLTEIARSYGKTLENINYIFCSDDHLLGINRSYLQHDYYTDIITFPYGSEPIAADIFISVERVRDNARQYGVPSDVELRRVMAHGILHLCGLRDKKKSEKEEMRKAEENALLLWNATV